MSGLRARAHHPFAPQAAAAAVIGSALKRKSADQPPLNEASVERLAALSGQRLHSARGGVVVISINDTRGAPGAGTRR